MPRVLRDAGVWAVPALLLAALGTMLLRRGHGLWYDEAYTAEVAPLPLAELVRLVVDGQGPTAYLPGVPPSFNAPYYALVHLWLSLPGVEADETGLRLPSLLASVAAVAVLARTVQRLAAGLGPSRAAVAGLAAGVLAAGSPLLVEQAVEARSYGLAVLAVALTALGLSRWLDGAGGGLLLLGVAAAAAGLMHWFALPVVAGLALAAAALRGRAALPVLGVAAAAAVPTLALVGLSLSAGTAGSPDPPSVGAALPLLALRDWGLGRWPLVVLTLAAAGLGLASARRGGGARTAVLVGLAWLVVPLLVVTAAELVRPVYFPRYVLPALLGLAVLAAAGVAVLPRRASAALGAALLVATLAVTVPLAGDGPKERGDDATRLLAAEQVAGEPVVAADARAALALDHFVPRLAPRLADDLVLPPDDPPYDPSGAVWLVRFGRSGFVPTDDDAVLLAAGLELEAATVLTGVAGDLRVERWSRP